MLAKVISFGINGLDAYPVTIEIDVAKGIPATHIVGLPDSAIRESKERVRSAIRNSGYKYGPMRLTVNLSPADIRKEGPSFDLAIALGVLAATEQINPEHLQEYIFLGELSLDGHIQPVGGALPAALAVDKDRFKGIVLPVANAAEAAIVRRVAVYPAKSLCDIALFLDNPGRRAPYRSEGPPFHRPTPESSVDFSDVKGQAHVKRGLEIAAAGNHNILMIGPPGSGKSMLAKRLPTILPDMTLDESLESTKIHSVMGLLSNGQGLVVQRPFRSPHHTTSDVAIVGGGSVPRPGEVTLSHNGILFLDELPEFNRNVLEALRQPLEDYCVTISRAVRSVRFPSRFLLVCAMNPCPCGFFTDPKRECRCSPQQIQRYISKVSGPLLDRIDLHLEVPALSSAELLNAARTESSLAIKARILRARALQQERFARTSTTANSHMDHRQLKQCCPLDDEGKKLLKMAIEELGLSARAYDKVLKVARTIADLAGSDHLEPHHLAEAIQYRSLDRNWWR